MRYCVLDLETSINSEHHGGQAKDPVNDFYTVIIGSQEEVKVIHEPAGFKRELPELAKSILDESEILVGHNLQFDLTYIWNNQCFQSFLDRGGLVWDTQLAEYLMSGQLHSFASLAELQTIYLGTKVKKDRISQLFADGIGADKIIQSKKIHPRLFRLYQQYSVDDGITTLQVFKKQFNKAKQMGMLNIIKVYNNYLLSLVQTGLSGMKVDLEGCEKTFQELKIKSLNALKAASDITADLWDDRLEPFNINSPKHKSAMLFGGEFEITVKRDDGFYGNGNPKTKKYKEKVQIKGFELPTYLTTSTAFEGRYATGNEIIERIYNESDNEKAKEYCGYQRVSMNCHKMCHTYLKPFQEKSINGYIYPNFNNTKTITGRLSASNPNLQNVPSKGEMGTVIQKQLVAPEGWTAVSADFSQLEIYVVAYLTGDKALTSDLLSGIDFHIKRLSYAEDMSYDEVYRLCKVEKLPEWELKRSKAKTISYQKAYGATPQKLAKSTGLPEETIRMIFEKEDAEYSEVLTFNNDVTKKINNNKHISQAKHLPKMKKGSGVNSKRFHHGLELLPIVDKAGNVSYLKDEYRNIGVYECITGKRYAFEEIGRYDRFGRLHRGFSSTQTKNYQIQGTAGDIQAITSASLFNYIRKNPDKIRMVNEIHDSKWFYVNSLHLDEVLSIIKEKMENIPLHFKEWLNLDVPFRFPIDFKIGNNFAEMEEYKI